MCETLDDRKFSWGGATHRLIQLTHTRIYTVLLIFGPCNELVRCITQRTVMFIHVGLFKLCEPVQDIGH